jgi:hypothetical protein
MSQISKPNLRAIKKYYRIIKEDGFAVTTKETAANEEWENGNDKHVYRLLGLIAAPIRESSTNSLEEIQLVSILES